VVLNRGFCRLLSKPLKSDGSLSRNHDRRPLLRRRWPAFAVVAGAVVLVTIVLPIVSDDPRRGALAVAQHGGTLYLRVEDALADPQAMTNDLQAAGLDARVEIIPVGPSSVGVWVDVVNDSTTGYNDPRISDLFRQMYPEEDEGTEQAGIPHTAFSRYLPTSRHPLRCASAEPLRTVKRG